MGDTLDKPDDQRDGAAAGQFPNINIAIKTENKRDIQFASNDEGSYINTGEKWIKLSDDQKVVVDEDGLVIKDKDNSIVATAPKKNVTNEKPPKKGSVQKKSTVSFDEEASGSKKGSIDKPKVYRRKSSVKIENAQIKVDDLLDEDNLVQVSTVSVSTGSPKPKRDINWYYVEPIFTAKSRVFPTWVPLDYYDNRTDYSILEIGHYPSCTSYGCTHVCQSHCHQPCHHHHGHGYGYGHGHGHGHGHVSIMDTTVYRPYSYGYPYYYY